MRRPATPLLAALAAAQVLLHLATAAQYGYRRDELLLRSAADVALVVHRLARKFCAFRILMLRNPERLLAR